MTLIEWQKEFETGVAEVDHEHKELVELLNELHAKLGAGASQEEVSAFLGEVFAKISAHFALEEHLMRESAYIEFEDHKDDHEELLDQIRDMMDQIDADPQKSFEILEERLSGWFERHFSTFDARLHGKLGGHH
jgi:hemerythrin